MNTPDPRSFEARLHQHLRALPDRPAPRSLEQRVLQEIARRQALPWWQQSFHRWPTPVKFAFLVVSTAVAAAVVWLLWGVARDIQTVGWSQVAARPLNWFAQLQTVGASLSELVLRHLPVVSRFWIYAGIAAFVSGYALLFGLGAAAYQTLWKSR